MRQPAIPIFNSKHHLPSMKSYDFRADTIPPDSLWWKIKIREHFEPDFVAGCHPNPYRETLLEKTVRAFYPYTIELKRDPMTRRFNKKELPLFLGECYVDSPEVEHFPNFKEFFYVNNKEKLTLTATQFLRLLSLSGKNFRTGEHGRWPFARSSIVIHKGDIHEEKYKILTMETEGGNSIVENLVTKERKRLPWNHMIVVENRPETQYKPDYKQQESQRAKISANGRDLGKSKIFKNMNKSNSRMGDVIHASQQEIDRLQEEIWDEEEKNHA